MGKAVLQKIRITGLKKHYKILMQELHRKGILEIVDNKEFIQHSVEKIDQHFDVFDLARIEFAIQFLSPLEPKKHFLDTLFSGGKIIISEDNAKERLLKISPLSEKIISECETIEYERNQAKQEIEKMEKKEASLQPLKNLRLPLQKTFNTHLTKTVIASFAIAKKQDFLQKLAQESRLTDLEFLHEDKNKIFIRLSYHTVSEQKIKEIMTSFEVEVIDLQSEFVEFLDLTPRDILRHIEKTKKTLEEKIEIGHKKQKELAVHTDDLRILYDYNAWRKRKHDLQFKILRTNTIFAFEAWIPKNQIEELEKWMLHSFVREVSLDLIAPNEDEMEPVLFQNSTVSSSFEPITEMFGIPTSKDIDPTPFLAPFFFVFFGLCLSDVGYGLILFLASLTFLLLSKVGPEAQKGLRLLTFSGFSAILGGIILGSYFGMTPQQIPGFLSFLFTPEFQAGVEGALPFKGQFIDTMSGSGPITLLILTVGIGFVHLLFGLLLDFYKNLKNKDYITAFCDSLTWFLFLVSLVAFSLADKIPFVEKEVLTNAVLVCAGLLILTQGRDQKIWILKPISGALGLFGITGYLSDLLSYSRLMALGLATGVIAFAMNLTAEVLYEMMPHWSIGLFVAIVILLFGHSLNFALSVLGAFVHSGRLQFIEFFSKFFDGNGRKFDPFERQKKYLFFKNNT